MPTIYILKNIFSTIFFNSLNKILNHVNSNMNLNWNIEIFNSKIELDTDGNSYITLYDYEYDIMNVHIFEVDNFENISFIEYSVGTCYDYDIYLGMSTNFWCNIMNDLRNNYIKNKNISIEVEDKSLLNYKSINVKYSVNFSFRSYNFIYDIIYE